MNRNEWLAMLAKLTTPHDPVKALQAMLAYSPFLTDLPPAAFTAASVEYVAMQPRRLAYPDLSEVKGPLQAWWRDNGPRRTALPSRREPQREESDMTPEQRAEAVRVLRSMTASVSAPSSNVATITPRYADPAQLAEARKRLAERAK